MPAFDYVEKKKILYSSKPEQHEPVAASFMYCILNKFPALLILYSQPAFFNDLGLFFMYFECNFE